MVNTGIAPDYYRYMLSWLLRLLYGVLLQYSTRGYQSSRYEACTTPQSYDTSIRTPGFKFQVNSTTDAWVQLLYQYRWGSACWSRSEIQNVVNRREQTILTSAWSPLHDSILNSYWTGNIASHTYSLLAHNNLCDWHSHPYINPWTAYMLSPAGQCPSHIDPTSDESRIAAHAAHV